MKLLRIFIVALALLIGPVAYAAPTLQTRVIEVAKADLGLKERTNRNDHPRIDQVLDYIGVPRRNPYCASFVVWWYNHAGSGNVLPKYPRVAALRDYMVDHELKYKIVDPEAVLIGATKLKSGDVIFWVNGKVSQWTDRLDFNGHTGLVEKQVDRSTFRSIEANTQPGDTGDQREGGGVFERTRKIKTTGKFKIMDFGRVR